MQKEEAEYHRDNDGWSVVEDAGRGYRRVVASPKPLAIVESGTVRKLLDSGSIVIAAGGGGIPVVRGDDGLLYGREAVVDKDLAAAILAKDLKADLFVISISTAVEKVCLNYNKPDEKRLDTVSSQEAKTYMAQGHFGPGPFRTRFDASQDPGDRRLRRHHRKHGADHRSGPPVRCALCGSRNQGGSLKKALKPSHWQILLCAPHVTVCRMRVFSSEYPGYR